MLHSGCRILSEIELRDFFVMLVAFGVAEAVNVRRRSSIEKGGRTHVHLLRHEFRLVTGTMIDRFASWFVRLVRRETGRRGNFAVIDEIRRNSCDSIEGSVRSESFWRWVFGLLRNVPLPELSPIRCVRIKRSWIALSIGRKNRLGWSCAVGNVVSAVSRIAIDIALRQWLVIRAAGLRRRLIPWNVILSIGCAIGHGLRFIDDVLRGTYGVDWFGWSMNVVVPVVGEWVERCFIWTILLPVTRHGSLVWVFHVLAPVTRLIVHWIAGYSSFLLGLHGSRRSSSFAGVVDADGSDSLEWCVRTERLWRRMLRFLWNIPLPVLGSIGRFSSKISG